MKLQATIINDINDINDNNNIHQLTNKENNDPLLIFGYLLQQPIFDVERRVMYECRKCGRMKGGGGNVKDEQKLTDT